MTNKPMFILVGPSGAGKSSFVKRLTEDLPRLVDTVTYTTRPMRSGESEGSPYHFVSREKFEELVSQDFFVEWAKVHSNMYGTPHYQIQDAWKQGRAVIMDVDVQGAYTFKQKFPHALTVFILPPSVDALRQRVAKRDGGNSSDFELRMSNAEKEMALADTFDRQLINDEFEPAYARLKKMIEEVLQSR